MEVQRVVPLLHPPQHHVGVHLPVILELVPVRRVVLHLDLFGEELLLELGVLVVALLELGLLAYVGVLPIVPVQYLPPLLVPAALSLS